MAAARDLFAAKRFRRVAPHSALWAKIVADNNVGASWPTTFELLGLFTEDDHVSGDWHSDLVSGSKEPTFRDKNQH